MDNSKKIAKESVEFVNPKNLIYCREKAGLKVFDVYKKAGWSPVTRKIENWEAGEGFPTISELKKLGKIYKRAWTLFLLDTEIKELGFSVMLDYRKIINAADEQERYEVINFINEMQRRQGVLLEFSDVLEIESNSIFGSLSESSNVDFVANAISNALKIDFDSFYKQKTRKGARDFLQSELGKNNIFVSFSSLHPRKQIPVECMRGVLLHSTKAPMIGINSADKSVGAQIFTIFHEITHLFIEPVDSEPIVETVSMREVSKKSAKERFCDEVAARILVPDSVLRGLRGQALTPEIVETNCKLLKINREPFLYRAKSFGIISQTELKRFLSDRSISDNDVSKKYPTGTPDGGLLHLLKNGKVFTKRVGTLYMEGALTYSQALGVLDVKSATFNHFVVR
jgi:Zn-dependent peptidase ImmA (M78 family)